MSDLINRRKGNNRVKSGNYTDVDDDETLKSREIETKEGPH